MQRNMPLMYFSGCHDETIFFDETLEQVIYFFVVHGWGTLSNVFILRVLATYTPVSLQLVQNPRLELIVGLHTFIAMNIHY